jgi:hypothetical protein
VSIIGGAEPSRAEMLERIRVRARERSVQWWPEVSEKIKHLKTSKREAFAKDGPERGAFESATVDYLDLLYAITDGNPVVPGEGDIAYEAESWSCPVIGLDRLGNTITVFIRLPRKEESPIQITDFLLSE